MNDIVLFYKSHLRVASRYIQKHEVRSFRNAFCEVAIYYLLFYYNPSIGPESASPVSFVDTPILAQDPFDPLKVPPS